MAKLYRAPAFFFRLQLLLFLITNEFNLMFCWAQFTFSVAFVPKLTPGLSDLLPCFPNPGSSLPANCSAPCLERAIVSKTTPQTKPRLLPTENPTHFNCSTRLNEQTKSNPGSSWAFPIHTEMQWHLIFIAVVRHANHPLHCHHPCINCVDTLSTVGEKKWTRASFCRGKTHNIPGSVSPWIFFKSVQ